MCYGSEVLIIDSMSRASSDSQYCGEGGPLTDTTVTRYSRSSVTCSGKRLTPLEIHELVVKSKSFFTVY